MTAAASMEPLLVAEELTKSFAIGRRRLMAVNNVSLTVSRGATMGLVGESGCGKSTLGRTVVRLYQPDSGTLRFAGQPIAAKLSRAAAKNLGRRLQMIFQDPYSCLNPRMAVRDILLEGPRAHRLWDAPTAHRKVDYWLERVGLHPDHANRYAHEFSGGQRQRLGIARALILGPEMVVCDEPISALDVSVQAQIVRLLRDLQAEENLTYLFISHDLSMVRSFCDTVAVMYLGRLVEVGPAQDLYREPLHPYSQALVAANPIPDPVREQQRRRQSIRGEVASPIDPQPGCLFAARCPYAQDICRQETPPLREIRPGRQAACHLI